MAFCDDYTFYDERSGRTYCVDSCATVGLSYYSQDKQCISTCPYIVLRDKPQGCVPCSGIVSEDDKCLPDEDKCPSGFIDLRDYKCVSECELGSSDGVHCDTCDWDVFPQSCLERSGTEVVRITEKTYSPWWLIALLSIVEVLAIALTVYLCVTLRKKKELLREKQEKDAIEERRRACFLELKKELY